MKNKKGFTLIELLAVIVILAIIALIATPIILNMIENAKKGAAKDSAYGYIEAIEYNNSIADLGLNNNYTKIPDGEDLDVTGLEVKIKGTKPESGTVTIEKGNVKEAELCINNYIVIYDGKIATTGTKCSDTEKEEVTGPTSENPDTTKTKGLLKIVYLDPTKLTKTCTKEDAEKNLNENGTPTGIKTGCMKWYAYKDDGTNYTMILDHNTTPLVAWITADDYATANTDGTDCSSIICNDEGPITITRQLKEDTTGWEGKPRLITADEITEITENNSWNKSSMFYFETNTSQQPSPYVGTFGWLYDNIYRCTRYGCNVSDDNEYKVVTGNSTNSMHGYWTSIHIAESSNYAWFVHEEGIMTGNYIGSDNSVGLRPVITIDKSIIK